MVAFVAALALSQRSPAPAVAEIAMRWSAADDLTLEWTYRQEETILAKPPKAKVAYSRVAVSSRMDGADVPVTPGLDPHRWEAAWEPGKAPDHGKGFTDYSELRLQRLIYFAPPATSKVEGSWTLEFPEIPIERAPKATAKWTVVKVAEGAAELRLEYSESGIDRPMTATGSGTYDLKLQRVVKLDVQALQAPIPGGTGDLAEYRVKYRVLP